MSLKASRNRGFSFSVNFFDKTLPTYVSLPYLYRTTKKLNLEIMEAIIETFEIENGQIEIDWFTKDDIESTTTTFPINDTMLLEVLINDVDFIEWSRAHLAGALLTEFNQASFDVFEHVVKLLTNHLNKG